MTTRASVSLMLLLPVLQMVQWPRGSYQLTKLLSEKLMQRKNISIVSFFPYLISCPPFHEFPFDFCILVKFNACFDLQHARCVSQRVD